MAKRQIPSPKLWPAGSFNPLWLLVIIPLILYLLLIFIPLWFSFFGPPSSVPQVNAPSVGSYNQRTAPTTPLPAEPSLVYEYTGYITSLNRQKKQLVIATSRGDKVVSYTEQTVFASTQLPSDEERRTLSGATLLDRLSQELPASETDLALSRLLIARSNDNISGQTTFSADKITFLQL